MLMMTLIRCTKPICNKPNGLLGDDIHAGLSNVNLPNAKTKKDSPLTTGTTTG